MPTFTLKLPFVIVTIIILALVRAEREHINVATGKFIKGRGGSALKVLVDGNRDTCIPARKVKIITIDLGRPCDVDRIRIRVNQMHEDYPNVKIRAGNTTKASGNIFCSVHRYRADGILLGLDCHAVVRYITVQRVGKVGTSSICDIEAISEVCKVPVPLVDVSEGKFVTETSDKLSRDLDGAVVATGSRKHRSYSVRGHASGLLEAGVNDMGANFVYRSSKVYQPWWRLDLGESFDVYQVEHTNTDECTVGYPILDAEIRVGDDGDNFNRNAICGEIIQRRMVEKERYTFHCGCGEAVRGRYVSGKLKSPTNQMFHICSLRVMAG